jgi:hypothetical protein
MVDTGAHAPQWMTTTLKRRPSAVMADGQKHGRIPLPRAITAMAIARTHPRRGRLHFNSSCDNYTTPGEGTQAPCRGTTVTALRRMRVLLPPVLFLSQCYHYT